MVTPWSVVAIPSLPRNRSEQVVRRQGQELDEVVGEGDLLEGLGGLSEVGLAWRGVCLFTDDRQHVFLVDAAVVDPLPDLGARDLGGGDVLHQVVDRGGA